MTEKEKPSKDEKKKKEKPRRRKIFRREIAPDAKEIYITHKERVKRFQLKNIPQRYESTSIFKGVRRMKSGKYSVEIRNPFEKVTEHIGTFEKEVQACLAHERRFEEFQRIKQGKREREEVEEEDEVLLGVDRSCKEQGNGFGGGKKNEVDDPSDDDNDNIGGGGSHSHQSVVLDAAVAV